MASINFINQREMQDFFSSKEMILRADFYKELNKLREQIINLNDIIKVLKRE